MSSRRAATTGSDGGGERGAGGSGRRRAQAAETRRLILDAARRLFAERGYGATSIAELAEAAGVAVPTIYASVGTKRRILDLLLDHIEEDAGLDDLVAGLLASDDPAEVLGLQVRITRQLDERCGDVLGILRAAVATEPDLVEAYEAGLRRHRDGCASTVARLAAQGALDPAVTEQDATLLLELMTSPSSWSTLTVARGLDHDRAERLLRDALGRLLLHDE